MYVSSQFSYKHFDCKTSEERSASQKNAFGKAASLKTACPAMHLLRQLEKELPQTKSQTAAI